MNIANKLGDIAGRVSGVKMFKDMLNTEIVEVSENAKQIGLQQGCTYENSLARSYEKETNDPSDDTWWQTKFFI